MAKEIGVETLIHREAKRTNIPTAELQSVMDLMEDGVVSEEIGLFVRSDAQLPRALAVAATFGIPATQLGERIEAVADDAHIDEVYNAERHLLYVACTGARDLLLVTGVEPVSEFLDDLRGAP